MRAEFAEVVNYSAGKSFDACRQNAAKSRFPDIVCYDETRVVLGL